MNKKSQNVVNWRIRTKRELIEYKGGKCEICGYDKVEYHRVFHFHHIDPTKKEFGISSKIVAFDKAKEEVDKCMLLCSRCHDELHSEIDGVNDDKLIRKNSRREVVEKECSFCGTKFSTNIQNRSYCSQPCASGSRNMRQRKIKENPTKEELAEMLKTMSWCAIGRKYFVTDNSVRKWARKYGLIPPKPSSQSPPDRV